MSLSGTLDGEMYLHLGLGQEAKVKQADHPKNSHGRKRSYVTSYVKEE